MDDKNMKDNRNPEAIGKMLTSLKVQHPELTAAERADMIEDIYSVYGLTIHVSSNGK